MTTTPTAPEAPAAAPARGPLDPITRPLWRMKRTERRKIMEPFLGKAIRVDRWYGRVASQGDRTYKGTLLAIAETTTGGNSNLLIMHTFDGMCWAISDAQVAYVEHIGKDTK